MMARVASKPSMPGMLIHGNRPVSWSWTVHGLFPIGRNADHPDYPDDEDFPAPLNGLRVFH
jgi:hypothetical protein